MAYDEQQLEAMVRQVLERLGALQPVPQTVASSSKPAVVTTQPSNNANQQLTARVIGTRELESVKSETKRVIVQRGTVVTPAARDWLREKKIELAWATGGSATKPQQTGGKMAVLTAKPATRQIVVGQAAARFDATALVRQLVARGYAVQRLAHAGLEQVARELAAAAAFDGTPAVLLTDQPWAAVVAANRNPSARAAWVRDRRETLAALREMNMNLAIISVTGQSPFGIVNTVLPLIERQ
jgi:hypothetical protein